ncbi:MAG: helix-turn-helix domain-containing protein, partial [Bacteroidales bacterium]|nr:helix-turn-helix domain-containing protein [Bacteroidales bacterium]
YKIDITAVNWLKQGSQVYLSMANYLVFIVSMFWYWILVFKLIGKHQQAIGQQFSFENTKLRLNWVKLIAWWILGGFILSGITYFSFVIKNIYPFNPVVIFHFGLLLFVFSISFFGIHQTDLKLVKERQTLQKKHMDGVTKDELSQLHKRLDIFMQTNKPFLRGELTLEQLAKETGESVSNISFLLNHYLKKNFFTYINEYRVEEVKQRILAPENKKLTLLSIGYDSGFNSKSSFNSIFKKLTGLTPSEYQKRKLAS